VRALRAGDTLWPTGRTVTAVGIPWHEAGSRRAVCRVGFTAGPSARWNADTLVAVDRADGLEAGPKHNA
jgi:hypothetical protein